MQNLKKVSNSPKVQKPDFIMSCRKCAPGIIRPIVSYFSQSLAMASEGICHTPRGERLIDVA